MCVFVFAFVFIKKKNKKTNKQKKQLKNAFPHVVTVAMVLCNEM